MANVRDLLARDFPRRPYGTLEEALAILDAASSRAGTTAGRALCAGLASDRVAYAVLGGYDAAMRKLLAPLALSRASFCVSESPGGAHPSAMETRLDERDGACFVTGVKSFATLATHAEVYAVVAVAGEATLGKKPLKVCLVARGAPGVRLLPRSPLPFAPELPHAGLELTDAPAMQVLPGDGYERYVKPFRTVEDAHVTLGVLGYALAEARVHGWSVEELSAVIGSLVPLADDADPLSPETHLALDTELGRARAVLDALPWSTGPADVAERWHRDRPILEVASMVRAKRTARARERVGAAQD